MLTELFFFYTSFFLFEKTAMIFVISRSTRPSRMSRLWTHVRMLAMVLYTQLALFIYLTYQTLPRVAQRANCVTQKVRLSSGWLLQLRQFERIRSNVCDPKIKTHSFDASFL